MNLTDEKPLQPLTHGNILLVGVKASNFDEEIRTHPRVIMWDSQNQHWTSKELPQNVRAVFVTRFISHNIFANLIKEARKRQITMFNPEGTGMIVKQVRELLDINRKPVTQVQETKPMTFYVKGKLEPLLKLVDPSKNIIENARFLMIKAKEMNIETTEASLAQRIGVMRRKSGVAVRIPKTQTKVETRTHNKVDVSVEILDNMVKELQDMRDYLVAVTEENQSLKARIEKFKKALDND